MCSNVFLAHSSPLPSSTFDCRRKYRRTTFRKYDPRQTFAAPLSTKFIARVIDYRKPFVGPADVFAGLNVTNTDVINALILYRSSGDRPKPPIIVGMDK